MAPVKKTNAVLGRTFLLEWREHRGLGQDIAAEMIDISRTLLSKMENGKTPYTQRTLEAAARAYRSSPAALLSINPNRADSFADLFETAEKLEGERRAQAFRIIEAALK